MITKSKENKRITSSGYKKNLLIFNEYPKTRGPRVFI